MVHFSPVDPEPAEYRRNHPLSLPLALSTVWARWRSWRRCSWRRWTFLRSVWSGPRWATGGAVCTPPSPTARGCRRVRLRGRRAAGSARAARSRSCWRPGPSWSPSSCPEAPWTTWSSCSKWTSGIGASSPSAEEQRENRARPSGQTTHYDWKEDSCVRGFTCLQRKTSETPVCLTWTLQVSRSSQPLKHLWQQGSKEGRKEARKEGQVQVLMSRWEQS